MRVGGWRRRGTGRRVAPALAGLLVFGLVAGAQGASPSSRLGPAAQVLGPPNAPEDYLERGRTTLIGEADNEAPFGEGTVDSAVAMSDDGRFTTFSRLDTPPDSEDFPISNIYITDRDSDENGVYDEDEGTSTTLVTLGFEQILTFFFRSQPTPGPLREPANNHSYDPDISADGRFVVFTSEASNLMPDSPDVSDPDVYRWDRLAPPDTPPVWVSSQAPTGFNFERSQEPTISDDGTRVVFRHRCQVGGTSIRAFVVSSPAFCALDTILVQGIQGSGLVGEPEMVPLEDPNIPGGNGIPLVCQTPLTPVISGDGASVFFVVRGATSQFNCQEFEDHLLARFDLANPATITPLPAVFDGVTIGANTEEDFNEVISDLSVSRTGQHVAFSAEFLGDRQVFVRDQATGSVELISGVAGQLGVCAGSECDPDSRAPAISSDGRYVAFRTRASNILRVDVFPSRQIVVRDRLNPAAENELVSSGVPPPSSTFPADFLGDDQSFALSVASHPGREASPTNPGVPAGLPFVAFTSFANNLDEAGDPAAPPDEALFVRSFTSARLEGPAAGEFGFGAGPVASPGNIVSIPLRAEPTGFGPASVIGAEFTPPNPTFSIITTAQCTAVQPSGLPCLVSVQFLPFLLGPVPPGLLEITYDTNPLYDESPFEDPDPLTITLLVTGTGVEAVPTVVVNPASIDFGPMTIGIASPPSIVTVDVTPGTFAVSVPASFTDIRLGGSDPGDYTIDASDCLGRLIENNSPCRVIVTFTATLIGTRSAVIEFFTSPTDPAPRLVPVTGSGIQPSIILNPAVVHSGGVIGVEGLDWPPGETVRLTVPGMPKTIDLVVQPDGTVELPTVIFRSRSFGPREVMAEVVDSPDVRLAQPVILLVQAPGSDVVDIIGRN